MDRRKGSIEGNLTAARAAKGNGMLSEKTKKAARRSLRDDMHNQLRNTPAQEKSGPIIRDHETWTKGDIAHQGDLIFVCLSSPIPNRAKPRASRQLAEGDTQGSRHTLDGGECFDIPVGEVARLVNDATGGRVRPTEQCCGPVFTGPATVRHPQHQDQSFPADTVTAVVYQRNLDAEEREIRARD